MKSFKQHIKKPKFKKHESGAFIISPDMAGTRKQTPEVKKTDKGVFNIPPSFVGIRKEGLNETYYDETDPSSLKWKNDPDFALNSELNDHYASERDSDGHDRFRDYAGGSWSMNDTLHKLTNGEMDRSQLGDYEKERIQAMDDAFAREKSAPKTYHTYTGLKFNPEDLFEQKDDQQKRSTGKISAKLKQSNPDEAHVHFPAFTSTSLSPSVSRDGFAQEDKDGIKHLLKFEIPEGSRYSTHMDASAGSYSGDELETLLNRGIHATISRTPEVIGNTKIWHTKITGHEPYKIQPIHPNASPEEVEEASKSSDPELRESAAEHQNANEDTLKRLSKDLSEKVRAGVASNKKTSSEMLHSMATREMYTPEKASSSVLKAISKNSNTQAHALHGIATNSWKGDHDIHRTIAQNQNADDATLQHIAHVTNNPNVLDSIAQHKNTSSDTLSHVYNNPNAHSGVKDSVISNKNISPSLLNKIVNDDDNYTFEGTHGNISSLLRNPSLSAENMHTLLDKSEGLLAPSDRIFHPTDGVSMAHHKNADASVLDKLHKKAYSQGIDYKHAIDSAVLENPKTSSDTIHSMIDKGSSAYSEMLNHKNFNDEHASKLLSKSNDMASWQKEQLYSKLGPDAKKKLSSEFNKKVKEGTYTSPDIENAGALGHLTDSHLNKISKNGLPSHAYSLLKLHDQGRIDLSPSHIGNIINSSPEGASHVLEMPKAAAKLSSTHINNLVDKNNSDINYNLVNQHTTNPSLLNSKQISKIAASPSVSDDSSYNDAHYKLVYAHNEGKLKLKPEDIDNITKENSDDAKSTLFHRHVTGKEKLTDAQINNLAKSKGKKTHSRMIEAHSNSTDPFTLSDEHIHNIIHHGNYGNNKDLVRLHNDNQLTIPDEDVEHLKNQGYDLLSKEQKESAIPNEMINRAKSGETTEEENDKIVNSTHPSGKKAREGLAHSIYMGKNNPNIKQHHLDSMIDKEEFSQNDKLTAAHNEGIIKLSKEQKQKLNIRGHGFLKDEEIGKDIPYYLTHKASTGSTTDEENDRITSSSGYNAQEAKRDLAKHLYYGDAVNSLKPHHIDNIVKSESFGAHPYIAAAHNNKKISLNKEQKDRLRAWGHSVDDHEETSVTHQKDDSIDREYHDNPISPHIKDKAFNGTTNDLDTNYITKSTHDSAIDPQYYLVHNHVHNQLEHPLEPHHIDHIVHNPKSNRAHEELIKAHNSGHINLSPEHIKKIESYGHTSEMAKI